MAVSIWLAAAAAPAASVGEPWSSHAAASSSQAEDLVFTTDDDAVPWWEGCDAIWAFDAATGDVIVRGEQQVSPGRLATTSDGAIVLSVFNNAAPGLHTLVRSIRDPSKWFTHLVDVPSLVEGGPIAITPDDRFFLLATASRPVEIWDMTGLRDSAAADPRKPARVVLQGQGHLRRGGPGFA